MATKPPTRYIYIYVYIYIFPTYSLHIPYVDPPFGPSQASLVVPLRRIPLPSWRGRCRRASSLRCLRKTMGKPGKPWENHGKTMGKPGKQWENHGKIPKRREWLEMDGNGGPAFCVCWVFSNGFCMKHVRPLKSGPPFPTTLQYSTRE